MQRIPVTRLQIKERVYRECRLSRAVHGHATESECKVWSGSRHHFDTCRGCASPLKSILFRKRLTQREGEEWAAAHPPEILVEASTESECTSAAETSAPDTAIAVIVDEHTENVVEEVAPSPPPATTEKANGKRTWSSGKPRHRIGRLRGSNLLALADEVAAEMPIRNAQKLADKVGCAQSVVDDVVRLPALTPEFRALIVRYELSAFEAMAIGHFAPGVRVALSEAVRKKRLHPGNIGMARIWHQRNHGSARQLLADQDFTDWPAGLDDEGYPVPGKEYEKNDT